MAREPEKTWLTLSVTKVLKATQLTQANEVYKPLKLVVEQTHTSKRHYHIVVVGGLNY